MKRFLTGLPPVQQFYWDEAMIVAFHGRSNNGGRFPHIGGQNSQWPWETDIVLVGHPDRLFIMIGHPDMLFLSLALTRRVQGLRPTGGISLVRRRAVLVL